MEPVRIASESTPRAPAVEGGKTAKIGPFRKIGFAQDDSARGAQLSHNNRIPRHLTKQKGEGARGRLHTVMRSNVILEQNRDAVERTTNLPGLALLVALLGNLKRVAICFDNGIQQWIELGDSFQVVFHQFAAGKGP